jgi:YidC/Oxa1 family membrane protein insertase
VRVDADGNIEALQPGEVTIQGTIPGLAADKGFLFIDRLGRVGLQIQTAQFTGILWQW